MACSAPHHPFIKTDIFFSITALLNKKSHRRLTRNQYCMTFSMLNQIPHTVVESESLKMYPVYTHN